MDRWFVGRDRELDRLRDEVRRLRHDAGRLLIVRGRRQVGKSTLLEHFLSGADVPGALWAAARGRSIALELEDFSDEIAASSLEAAQIFRDARFATCEAALRALAAATTRPSVLVLDEFPYLVAADPSFEGMLQRAWDRVLSKVPLLLVLLGSDLSVMEMLTGYERPLYGRAAEMRLDPLHPADVADMLALDASTALDGVLVTGGLPRLVAEWRHTGARAALDFVDGQLRNSTSPLVVLGERTLAAEFPPTLRARDVLTTIGAGETSFSRISERAGIDQGSLTRILAALTATGALEPDRPLSARPSRLVHYRVADSYLRFWLRFVGPALERIVRSRGDLVAAEVARSWPRYRGVAVEPVVRRSVERLLPHEHLGSGTHVGRWWSREGDSEVDLVVADSATAPTTPTAVGSITWRDQHPFDARDLAALHRHRHLVPGAADAATIAVGRAGVAVSDVDLALVPEDLVAAWR